MPPEPSRLQTAIAYLATYYPRQTVSPALVHAYTEALADTQIEAVEEAIRRIVRTADWFPPVSQILRVAAEVSLEIPSEAVALAQVEGRLALPLVDEPCPACQGAITGDDEEPCPACRGNGLVRRRPGPPLHPKVREALDLVGGEYGFRNAEKPEVVRAQFLRVYASILNDALRERQIAGDRGPLQVPGLNVPKLREIR